MCSGVENDAIFSLLFWKNFNWNKWIDLTTISTTLRWCSQKHVLPSSALLQRLHAVRAVTSTNWSCSQSTAVTAATIRATSISFQSCGTPHWETWWTTSSSCVCNGRALQAIVCLQSQKEKPGNRIQIKGIRIAKTATCDSSATFFFFHGLVIFCFWMSSMYIACAISVSRTVSFPINSFKHNSCDTD